MIVDCVQLCQGPDVIAVLQNDSCGTRRWFIPLAHGNYELVDNDDENRQLYHCIQGDFTGYMVFRAVEYEDVVVCVVL